MTELEKWIKKTENHLAEYVYFSPSESYLFEACNLIKQLRDENERLKK